MTYRWASTSRTIYIGGPGETTLTEIESQLPSAPLHVVAPGTWFLGANMLLQTGAVLRLHGGAFGDVNVLRLKSNNATNAGSFVWISADWGAIDMQNTALTSWDEAAQGPDTDYSALYKRAYVRVRSKLDADGVTARESRMDIVSSDISYLGYAGSEAYGISWKVNGTQPNIFDLVGVYGDVINSRLHHLYYGFYSYGASGMRIMDNDVHDNIVYGIDPHDDSDYLLIQSNRVYRNGKHGIIASKRCDNVVVRGNVSFQNIGHGIMLHRECDDSVIEGNHTWSNGNDGIAVFDCRNVLVSGNLSTSNATAGVRLSVGASGSTVASNVSAFNGSYGFYAFRGEDLPRPGDDGRCKRNLYTANMVYGNINGDLRFVDSDEITLAGNSFAAPGAELVFEQCRRTMMSENHFAAGTVVATLGSENLPGTTVVGYHAEIRLRVDAYSAVNFESEAGQIYRCADAPLPTTILLSGSRMTLRGTTPETGVLVTMPDFKVVSSGGSAWVRPTVWRAGPQDPKRWFTTAAIDTQRFTYKVGKLTPGALYVLEKDGNPIQTALANSTGQVTFSDVAGNTMDIEYMIRGHLAGR